jgi:hypothetical protein
MSDGGCVALDWELDSSSSIVSITVSLTVVVGAAGGKLVGGCWLQSLQVAPGVVLAAAIKGRIKESHTVATHLRHVLSRTNPVQAGHMFTCEHSRCCCRDRDRETVAHI